MSPPRRHARVRSFGRLGISWEQTRASFALAITQSRKHLENVANTWQKLIWDLVLQGSLWRRSWRRVRRRRSTTRAARPPRVAAAPAGREAPATAASPPASPAARASAPPPSQVSVCVCVYVCAPPSGLCVCGLRVCSFFWVRDCNESWSESCSCIRVTKLRTQFPIPALQKERRKKGKRAKVQRTRSDAVRSAASPRSSGTGRAPTTTAAPRPAAPSAPRSRPPVRAAGVSDNPRFLATATVHDVPIAKLQHQTRFVNSTSVSQWCVRTQSQRLVIVRMYCHCPSLRTHDSLAKLTHGPAGILRGCDVLGWVGGMASQGPSHCFWLTISCCCRSTVEVEVHLPRGSFLPHQEQQPRERGSRQGQRRLVDPAPERGEAEPGLPGESRGRGAHWVLQASRSYSGAGTRRVRFPGERRKCCLNTTEKIS